MCISRASIIRRGWRVLLLAIPILASPGGSVAQERVDSLQAEVERLTALVDSLIREVASLRISGPEEEVQDALAQLRNAAQAAAAIDEPAGSTDPPMEQEFVGRQRSLQALNPEISVNTDLFGHMNVDDTS